MEPRIYKQIEGTKPLRSNESPKPLVSFISDVPAPLKESMEAFIESHPNWDQYRFIQAAVAAFLIQHGIESRSITRLYIDNVFPQQLPKGNML